MKRNQAYYPVATLCRVLDVSPSGYYAWLSRPPSARAVADKVLLERVREIHKKSRGTYGASRIHAELADEGRRIECKRVARLMHQEGLVGVSRRKGTRTTIGDDEAHPAPDLVE